MQQDEFNFMLDKLSTSVSSVLSLRKTHLLEIAKTAEKMTPQHDKITQEDFVQVMMVTMKQFSSRLNDLRSRIDVFEIKIQNERLPQYLTPGNTFMGKFVVRKAVSYNKIFKIGLLK